MPPLLALEPLTFHWFWVMQGPGSGAQNPKNAKKWLFRAVPGPAGPVWWAAHVVSSTPCIPWDPMGPMGTPPPISACHLWARRIYFKISQTQNLMPLQAQQKLDSSLSTTQ